MASIYNKYSYIVHSIQQYSLAITTASIMAPYCFIVEIQESVDAGQALSVYTGPGNVDSIIVKLKYLHEVCSKIPDEEAVIKYMTSALAAVIQKTERNIQCTLRCKIHHIELSIVSLKTIIDMLCDIYNECQIMDEVDDISVDIRRILIQVKSYCPSSTLYLVAKTKRTELLSYECY